MESCTPCEAVERDFTAQKSEKINAATGSCDGRREIYLLCKPCKKNSDCMEKGATCGHPWAAHFNRASRKYASDAGRKVCRVGKMGGSVCRHPSDCRHKTCRYPKHMPWIKNQHKARCGFAKNQVIYIIVIMFRLRV